MNYPIEIRSGRRHYIFIAICGLFILGLILVFMTTIGQTQHETAMMQKFKDIREMQATGKAPEIASHNTLINVKTIFLYLLCTTLAGVTAFVTFFMGKMAYRNPITVKFDRLGLTLMNNGIRKFEDLQVHWSDVESVNFYYRRVNLNRIRLIRLKLKDGKEVRQASVQDSSSSSNVISHVIKRNLKGVVDLQYTGKGMGFSHEEYFEFVKSEFLKHKTSQRNYSHPHRKLENGGRLFG